jgi:methionyl-tRNA formyltransferase
MKIVFFGSAGPFSAFPFVTLLNSSHQLSAVALYSGGIRSRNNRKFPILIENPESLEFLAIQNNVPVIELNPDISNSASIIAELQPDLILVSCFSRKLPDCLLSIPKMGCFNLHPSLLPAYRGPDPLFWQFKHGSGRFGITLHRMTKQFDGGEIIAQSTITMPDGISIKQAEKLLALLGAKLLESTLGDWQTGIASGIVQDIGKASYQSFPGVNDYFVNTEWSARRMYNFISATSQRGRVFACTVNGIIYRLVSANSYSAADVVQVAVRNDMITIPCKPGFVTARFVPG